MLPSSVCQLDGGPPTSKSLIVELFVEADCAFQSFSDSITELLVEVANIDLVEHHGSRALCCSHTLSPHDSCGGFCFHKNEMVFAH